MSTHTADCDDDDRSDGAAELARVCTILMQNGVTYGRLQGYMRHACTASTTDCTGFLLHAVGSQVHLASW